MHCKYCDVDIETGTKICPICHEKLEDIDESLERAYPEKIKRKRPHKHFTVKNIYLLVSFVLFLVCVTANYLTNTDVLWCYIAGGVLLYGFVLISNTVMSQYSIGAKVVVQTISIVLLILLIQWLTHTSMWAYNYALPIVHMVSVLVFAILVACFFKEDRNNLVSVIVFSMVGMLPLILELSGVLTELWPSLADAICSIIIIMTLVIFGHKEIQNEFRRKFHI